MPGVVMGTAPSLSPGSRVQKLAVNRSKPLEAHGQKKEKKRHPVLLQAARWRKFLVAPRLRRKESESPVSRLQASSASSCRSSSIAAQPGQDKKQEVISPRRVVVQASTGELLRCLSDFLRRRCIKLKDFPSNQIQIWFRNVDRALLVQGWQNQSFISPSSLVFVYLLCRDVVDEDMSSEQELHATFLTCLYLAYSYLGNEISYPLKPFLVDSSRDVFWERALEVIERLSPDMLRLNAEAHFFLEVFQDLKRQWGGWRREEPKTEPTEDRQPKNQDR